MDFNKLGEANKLGSTKLQQNVKHDNFLTNGSFKISPDVLESVFDGSKVLNASSVADSVFASNMATVEESGITESSYSDMPSESTMATTEEIETMIQGMMGDFMKSVEDAVQDALQNGINNTEETDETVSSSSSTSSTSATSGVSGTEKAEGTKSADSVNDKNEQTSIYDEIGKSKLNDNQRAAYEKYEKFLNEQLEQGNGQTVIDKFGLSGVEESHLEVGLDTKKEAIFSMVEEMSDSELRDFLAAYEIMNEDDGGLADLFFQIASGGYTVEGLRNRNASNASVITEYDKSDEPTLTEEEFKKISKLTALLSDKDKEKIINDVFEDCGHDGAGKLPRDGVDKVFSDFLNGKYNKGLCPSTFFNSWKLAGISSYYL